MYLLETFFFELLKKRIWHRESSDRGSPQFALFQRDYKVLKTLNANGNKKFRDIDRENALPNGSSRYSYHKLIENGILKRITISEQKLPIAYDALLQFKLSNVAAFESTRNNYRLDVVRANNEPYSSYAVIFDLLDPAGFLAIVPVKQGDSIEIRMDKLKAELKGVELTATIITGILIGRICHRKFDDTYARQYESLVKAHLLKQKQQIEYTKL